MSDKIYTYFLPHPNLTCLAHGRSFATHVAKRQSEWKEKQGEIDQINSIVKVTSKIKGINTRFGGVSGPLGIPEETETTLKILIAADKK